MKTFFTLTLSVVFILFWSCSEQYSTNPDVQKESDLSSTVNKGGTLNGTCPDIWYESDKFLKKNGVTVTWTSSFGGFDYTKGDDYTVTVTWSVDKGTVEFLEFNGKKKNTWTPKKDVKGSWSFDTDNNQLTVTMTKMHRSIEDDWHGYIGNGHFKLKLKVTNDGIVVKPKFGVNVHLEDPDSGYSERCP